MYKPPKHRPCPDCGNEMYEGTGLLPCDSHCENCDAYWNSFGQRLRKPTRYDRMNLDTEGLDDYDYCGDD